MDQQTPQQDTSAAAVQSGVSISKGAKKPKRPPPLHERVQEAYDILSDLAKKESWEAKERFPSNLREPLFACARVALETRTTGYIIEDHFFQHLQAILPYNKFTLKKLIYKNILPEWNRELTTKRDCMIAMFATRVENDKANPKPNPARQQKYDSDANIPRPSFAWSQPLRLLLWEIMEKFMEIRAIAQELNTVDPTTFPAQEPEEKAMKEAFSMILSCFPDGWVSVDEIARQYWGLKEKIKEPTGRRASPCQDERELIECHHVAAQLKSPSSTSIPIPRDASTPLPSPSKCAASPMFSPLSLISSPAGAMVQQPGDNEGKSADISGPSGKSNKYMDIELTTSTVSSRVRPEPLYVNPRATPSSDVKQAMQKQQHVATPTVNCSFTATERRLSMSTQDGQRTRPQPLIPTLALAPALPLPPSPISPQTPRTSTADGSMKLTVIATKRARDGAGADTVALRPMKVPQPHPQPQLQPQPQPRRSSSSPSWTQRSQFPSSSSSVAPGAQTTSNPRQIPPSVHNAIYDSLLRAQGGPMKKIRVDCRPSGDEKAAAAAAQTAERRRPDIPAQHHHIRPEQRDPLSQQQVPQWARQQPEGLLQRLSEERDVRGFQHSHLPQGKAHELHRTRRHHSMSQLEIGMPAIEHRRASEQWMGQGHSRGIQEQEPERLGHGQERWTLASDPVAGPQAPRDMDEHEIRQQEQRIRVQMEMLHNEQKRLQQLKQRKHHQLLLHPHQEQQHHGPPVRQDPAQSRDCLQPSYPTRPHLHRPQPPPQDALGRHPHQQQGPDYASHPPPQYHPRPNVYHQPRPMEGVLRRSSIEHQSPNAQPRMMHHPAEARMPPQVEVPPQARFPVRPSLARPVTSQGYPVQPPQPREGLRHTMSFHHRSDPHTRPR